MSAMAGLVLAAMCASGAVQAQDMTQVKLMHAVARIDGQADGRMALEANVVSVAARGAWTGTRAPSREELLDMLLVMSLRDGKGPGA
ncbi:MAG: hypothetical protein ACREHE_11695 [Rhizomicrobium sp.]